jgi:hypothetical protein
MGNIMISIKRFLGNKNTVTILGVLAGIVVLYVGYNWRVKQAVEPQSVPYAKVEIAGNTLITKDQVGTIKVSKSFVDTTSGLVTSTSQVIGKYVSYDTKIPEGGLFYSSQLMTAEQKPNYITEDIEQCHTLYSLAVTMHSTYANSIMPDDYIDLYISAMSDDNKVIVAKLIESIKVRDVRDSSGKSVFSSQSTSKTPAEIIFSVPNDMFLLLTRADNIKTNSIEIFPVPRNKEYTENASATQVTSQEIIDFINSKSDLSFSTSTSAIDQSCLSQ